MNDAKRSVRNGARAARRGVTASARAAASAAFAERVLGLPETARIRTVLSYAALPEELDPAPLVDRLRARGVSVAYPRVCGPGRLMLHWVEPDQLALGRFGILEPAADTPEAALDEIDLVLVPGCAFDAACRRLGMGGGFYDRLLVGRRPDTIALGVAFDEQVVGAVPTEEHDIPLDVVVTPTRTLRADR